MNLTVSNNRRVSLSRSSNRTLLSITDELNRVMNAELSPSDIVALIDNLEYYGWVADQQRRKEEAALKAKQQKARK
jgi:hypothetical protein